MLKESGTIPKKLRNTTNMTADEIAHYQQLNKMKNGPLGNATGEGSWFPEGTPNVDAAKANPNVQSALGDNVSRPIHNCAEPHALEVLKNADPHFVPGENYTLEIKGGEPFVKPPCNNCAAMGKVNAYGKVPFADYGGMSYADAAIAKLTSELKTGGLEQIAGQAVYAGSIDAPNPTPTRMKKTEKKEKKNNNTQSTNTSEVIPLLQGMFSVSAHVGASSSLNLVQNPMVTSSPISSLASNNVINDVDVADVVVDTVGYLTLGPVYGLIKLFK